MAVVTGHWTYRAPGEWWLARRWKGANPAELPVEVNTQIEFVINLQTAKALGLTIPPEVLFQADKIVR